MKLFSSIFLFINGLCFGIIIGCYINKSPNNSIPIPIPPTHSSGYIEQKIRPDYSRVGQRVLSTVAWHNFEIVASIDVYEGYPVEGKSILLSSIWEVKVINDSVKTAQYGYVERGLAEHLAKHK
jgi:hypothetical protein